MKRRAFVAAALASGWWPACAPAQASAVGVLDGPGVGAEALEAAIAAIEGAGLRAERVTPERMRREAGTFAALLFTGGRGSIQGRALGEDGREAVRRAVGAGVGYVGICGGSYLAMQGEPEFFKLGLVAARHATGDAWMRGIAPIEVVPEDGSPAVTLHYANGPLFAIEAVEGLPAPTVLARFGGEVALPEHGTHVGEMRGAPAVISARFGEGRLVLFSPNPNLVPAHDALLVAAIRRVMRGSSGPIDRWSAVF
jgi:hypothetical protein